MNGAQRAGALKSKRDAIINVRALASIGRGQSGDLWSSVVPDAFQFKCHVDVTSVHPQLMFLDRYARSVTRNQVLAVSLHCA